MRTLVNDLTDRGDWRADALEYGKFLWERTLMRVRESASLDDLLSAMQRFVPTAIDAFCTASGPF